jgi:hypothetical protein
MSYFDQKPDYMLDCWKVHVVCNDCLNYYIQNKINDCQVLNINCPNSSSALDKCENVFTE